MSFADLRARLLAFGALDVEWIKKVRLGVACGLSASPAFSSPLDIVGWWCLPSRLLLRNLMSMHSSTAGVLRRGDGRTVGRQEFRVGAFSDAVALTTILSCSGRSITYKTNVHALTWSETRFVFHYTRPYRLTWRRLSFGGEAKVPE